MNTVEKKHDFDYTDVLIWGSITVLILWIIGKLTGVIHSPAWVELVPFITIAGAIIGISLKAGIVLQKIDTLINDVTGLKSDMREVMTELRGHERRITILESAKE